MTDTVKRIPPAGWLETEDAETGERLLVDWADEKTRKELSENQDLASKDLRMRSHGAKADYLLFDGNEPSVQIIRHWRLPKVHPLTAPMVMPFSKYFWMKFRFVSFHS